MTRKISLYSVVKNPKKQINMFSDSDSDFFS